MRTGTLGNLRKKLPAPSSSVAAAADPAPPLAVASDETGEGAVGVRLHRAGSVRDQRTANSVLPKLSCPLSTIAESSKSATGGQVGVVVDPQQLALQRQSFAEEMAAAWRELPPSPRLAPGGSRGGARGVV